MELAQEIEAEATLPKNLMLKSKLFLTPAPLPAVNPQTLLDQVWARLEQHVHAIFSETQPKTHSLNRSARDIRSLIRLGLASDLKKRVTDKLTQLIQKRVGDLAQVATEQDTTAFLTGVQDFWASFCAQMKEFREVFEALESQGFATEYAVPSLQGE